jgi:peptidoglycan/xylan/chitin deacetylase (PgdA/CDA1 family)
MGFWKAGALVTAGLMAGMAVLATPSTAVGAAQAGPYLSPALTATEWSRLPTSDPVVALTFDAGANADGVASILATLQQYGVPATFFLTGKWAQSFPDSAAQIGASPAHAVGNHSYDHPDLTTLTDAEVRAEVAQAQSAIASATGRDTHPLFRFPYGARDARTIGIVNSMGYGSIRWTVDTLGWQGTSGGQSVDSVVNRVMDAAGAGEIVLMHIGSAPDGSTLDASALPTVIQRLQAGGFRFVNLAQAVKTLRVDTFARGTDGAIWHRWWDGQRWVAWESLGGLTPAESSPASASWAYNRLDVFVRGIDDQLWHRAWNGSGWSAWEPLGGILTSAPAAVARADNRLDVFVRGAGDGLWVRSWDGTRWTDWYPLGGILTSAPAASGADSAMVVVVRGQGNGLWAKSWDEHQGFTPMWSPLGGILTSAPASTLAGDTTHVFARGLDNGLWHTTANARTGEWSGWEPLGGSLTSAPAADSRSATTVDVFTRGGDHGLWTRWGTGTWWSSSGSLGGILTSGPSSAA